MKNLNIVVGEDAKGALKVIYRGTQRSEAQKALAKAVEEGKLDRVMHARNFHGRVKMPKRMARRKTEFRLEAEAAELPAAIAEATEAKDAAELVLAGLSEDDPKAAREEAKAAVEAATAALAELEARRNELVKIGMIHADD